MLAVVRVSGLLGKPSASTRDSAVGSSKSPIAAMRSEALTRATVVNRWYIFPQVRV